MTAQHLVAGAFVVFCRVGACLMLAPGLSSAMIPTQARLYIALAIALALAPLALSAPAGEAVGDDPAGLARAVAGELLIGGAIGFLARLFFLALETLAVATATMLGFSNPFGVAVEPGEALPPFATFLMLCAAALMFAMDIHWRLIGALADSYRVIPIGAGFDARLALVRIADGFGEAFRLALRVASPFFIYAIIVNLAMSLVNRLTPQIAVFTMATPFVLAGGLALLYATAEPMLRAFLTGFASFLSSG